MTATTTRRLSRSRPLPGIARLAIVLEIFLGIGALFGGGTLLLAPDGHLLGMTTKTLAGSPFRSYLVPGIILFAFVGVAPLLAAGITFRRRPIAPLAAVAVGLTLIGWISVEMVVLAGIGSLAWALYLVLGTCIAVIGVAWWRFSPPRGPDEIQRPDSKHSPGRDAALGNAALEDAIEKR